MALLDELCKIGAAGSRAKKTKRESALGHVAKGALAAGLGTGVGVGLGGLYNASHKHIWGNTLTAKHKRRAAMAAGVVGGVAGLSGMMANMYSDARRKKFIAERVSKKARKK